MSVLSEEVLSRVDIIDIVGRHVSLKKTGSNFTGLCPFHNEKSPSFIVSPQKQIYKCFGCGAGGNAIKFLMEYEKIDYMDAIKELSARVHFDYTAHTNHQPINREEKQKIKDILIDIQKRYIHSRGDVFVQYMTHRSIDHAQQDFFGLGYAPAGYGLIEYLKKNYTYDDMLTTGLIRKTSDYHVFLRDRIIFPIHNHMGLLVGFAGRVVDAQLPKYLNSPETSLYEKSKILYGLHRAKENIKTHQCLIVVEGYMDVIAFHKLGIGVAVATCGTALSIEHVKLLKRHTSTIKFMFDQDKAGQTATIRALKICLEADLFPQILEVQGYKDIDEYAQHHTTIDITGTDALSFVIGSSVEQYPLDSPITRQQYQNQIFDLIASIRDVGLAQFYLDKVADVLGLSQSIMTLTFSKWFKTRQQLIRKKDEPVLSSQPTDEQTIQSLIYQDFVQPYMTSEVDEGISIVCALWDLYDPAKLSEIFEHNDNFNELHLRRAKQLDTLSSDRQSIVIIQLIKSAIKKYYTHVLRDSHQGDLNRRIISFLK